jgi:hypothetical protein
MARAPRLLAAGPAAGARRRRGARAARHADATLHQPAPPRRSAAPPRPPPQIRDRDRAIRRAERLLRALTADPTSGVQFVERSRWMTIYEETSYMVGAVGLLCY